MSDRVENPEVWFSRVAAPIILVNTPELVALFEQLAQKLLVCETTETNVFSGSKPSRNHSPGDSEENS